MTRMMTDTELHGGRVIFDVIDMLERYIQAANVECLALPGHEATCMCDNHVKVREVHDEAVALIARVRGS